MATPILFLGYCLGGRSPANGIVLLLYNKVNSQFRVPANNLNRFLSTAFAFSVLVVRPDDLFAGAVHFFFFASSHLALMAELIVMISCVGWGFVLPLHPATERSGLFFERFLEFCDV